MDGSSAAARWERALASWAWPDHVLAAAPSDPWRLEPGDLEALQRRAAGDDDRHSPADVAALEALPRRGSVLDVGCGTGRSSAPLRRAAGRITGVDARPAMLERFAAATASRPGLIRRLAGGAPEAVTVEGRWPDVADRVEPADVVVSHHVLYDVGEDVAGFVTALTDHARRTVVLELTDRHPLAWLAPYAEQLHGIGRPTNPTAELAAELVREVTGTTPTLLRWTVDYEPPHDEAAFERIVARRCCVGEDRIDDVRLALHRTPPPSQRAFVALVWPGTAG